MQKLPKKMRCPRKIREGQYKDRRGMNFHDLQAILEANISEDKLKMMFEWTNLDTNQRTQIPVSDEETYAKKLEEFMFPDVEVKDQLVHRHRFRMEMKSVG